ncbi:septation protein A [Parashewanella curva]|uniref:Inner membrane-spanning protein YciB n=1 Tax=Parashewanella curva TaxID=2338552 RepID=A0A3L8PTW6_9GAMM|nr:septation protein A [Parashewanella curva]RLV58857.1 septation protein A [Parashewanella curva]
MKQILEFLPLIIFFLVYKFFDIYVATGALIAATLIQLIVTYLLYKKIEKMLLVTFAMVAIFGTLTIVFHDDNFIKWKVTLIYMLFAGLLIGSQLMNRSIIKSMLGKEIEAPEKIWRNLTFYWAAFFSVCAAINIYIAYNFSLETWVNFKVFGLTILSIINLVGTIAYLYPHLPQEENDKE